MNTCSEKLNWLLSGDPAIVYQTSRDLLGKEEYELKVLQSEIVNKGWGADFLSRQNPETFLWGDVSYSSHWLSTTYLYSPKWISTTYTMLDLKNLGISPEIISYQNPAKILVENLWQLPVKRKDRYQDLCIVGMLLNIGCYGKISHTHNNEMIDYVLDKQMPDGGWNCQWHMNPTHSSLHTTINLLEGLAEYIENGYSYRVEELINARNRAHEFILMHRLYRSDKTGEIIKKQMTMLSYPSRWKYDVLRALDYFQRIDWPYDERMGDALELLKKKRMKNGLWQVQYKHPGRVHFDMEATGKVSRWNTLRAQRVLKKYDQQC